MELISVIIPVYNSERFIARCLESVINNTYKNLQIICVNDGSTDESGRILTEYMEKDKRISVINKDNGGAASARKAGILAAKGDYIAMLDADDWIHPQYFDILIHFQKKLNTDIVVCHHKVCQNYYVEDLIDVEKIEYQVWGIHEGMNNFETRSLVWGRLYTRKCIANHLPPEGIIMGEDTLYNIIVMCSYNNIQIGVLDCQLYYYCENDTSVMHTTSYNEVIYVSEWLLLHIDSFHDEECKKEILERCFKINLSCRYAEMFNKNRVIYNKTKELFVLYFKDISNMRGISRSLKIRNYLLYYFPLLYRIMRIVQDPTLLQWEKSLKKKR